MVGFGVVNSTGIGEELSQNVKEGAKNGVKYYVAIMNVGSSADQFTVRGTQISGGQGWTISYFLGTKPSDMVNITSGVEAGTFQTSTMEAGAVTGDSTMIVAEVSAAKTVLKDTTATFTVTFTSNNDPMQQDAVRITAVAK